MRGINVDVPLPPKELMAYAGFSSGSVGGVVSFLGEHHNLISLSLVFVSVFSGVIFGYLNWRDRKQQSEEARERIKQEIISQLIREEVDRSENDK